MTVEAATPESIRAAQTRLAAAGEALRARPRDETLATLCSLLDEFAKPDGAARLELVAALPAATGFHPDTVRAGLDLALPRFTGEALRELVACEQQAAPGCGLEGFAQTSVLLAGAIPMPTITTLVLPLVLRSPVLAKTASRDPVTASVLVRALAQLDPELAQCVELVAFPRSDEACTHALTRADCVVATGSDETIQTISRALPATTRFAGFGHRLSVALLGSAALAETHAEEIAFGLARDVALWDQQGCLSPVAIFCEGGAEEAKRLGRALCDALGTLERRWPRGALAPEEAAGIRSAREEAQMRLAADASLAIFSDESTRFTVVAEDDLRWRKAPLHRFVRIHHARELAALMDAIAQIGKHLAAVAIAGFDARAAFVGEELSRRGASRICAPGEMQAPPLGWHHDGQLLLAPLARITDLE